MAVLRRPSGKPGTTSTSLRDRCQGGHADLRAQRRQL